MKVYLKEVQEKLKEKQKKVNAQQKVVDAAKKELDDAKKVLFERKKDVEKLKIHKTAWKKEMLIIEKRIESLEQDEMGSARFAIRKHEMQKKKRS
jgi:predicted  nucleic acid-binding Zn-ribbon protein